MKTRSQLKEYQAMRDFKKTAEPKGAVRAKRSKRLAFVVQKHEASHLHYDIRLEVDGVMKSWACPKGPSFDPAVKRLAVQVEDHPTAYNDFEGTIPSGEYGGGTVMIWDCGYYTVDDVAKGDDPETLMRDGLEKGKLSFTFHGQKLRGSFALVRTRLAARKPQWLLIKHKDEAADPGYDPVADDAMSAKTKRPMAAIKSGKDVWRSSNQSSSDMQPDAKSEPQIKNSRKGKAWSNAAKSPTSTALAPMLMHLSSELPVGSGWVYEQKLDGVRLLAYADAQRWVVVSRLGNDKSKQFPELGEGLKKIAKATGGPLILDGEVVAIDGKKKPLGFQSLQNRIHLDDSEAVDKEIAASPVAFLVFDALLIGDTSIADYSWSDRRALLDKIFKQHKYPRISLLAVSVSAKGMKAKAAKEGWEGLIAKDIESPYLPGVRTKNWLKWKSERREELIIGGWTEPKGTRHLIGSLLIGYYDEQGAFIFAGHVGSGFNRKVLEELYNALTAIEIKKPAFATQPATNDQAHWVKPKLVAEIKFQEWTSDRVLRQPTFIGIRDDKNPKDVVLRVSNLGLVSSEIEADDESEGEDGSVTKSRVKVNKSEIVSQAPVEKNSKNKRIRGSRSAARTQPTRSPFEFLSSKTSKPTGLPTKTLIKAIQGIEDQGEIALPGGDLRITHIDKVIYPKDKITKRDLLDYYTIMAEYILPWMEDRPLVLRRFPGGIDAKDFYQQAPDSGAPGRIQTLSGDQGETQERFIGGDLLTLLYTVQMSCVSYDPWHSRIDDLMHPDYTIIDLDPVVGTSFETVRSVAIAVLDYLQDKGLKGAMKTSGATGIHIYLPLPPRTTLEQARLVAEIVCTEVAEIHPHATFERSVKKRKKGSVYLDSQQNYLSKSVAGVWAVRARPMATVSTPISRAELIGGATPQDFTIVSVIAEARKRTALWNQAMKQPIDMSTLAVRKPE